MPFAANALDGCSIYFEDDGGEGPPVVFLNGLGDPVAASRRWGVSAALAPDHRCIYVDQRGMGLSGKPHQPEAYAIDLRVADVLAVLDSLQIERAHVIGLSWGARLAFAMGEHASHRLLSLTMGGQTPYAMNGGGPLVRAVTRAFQAGGGMTGFLRSLGGSAEIDLLIQEEVLANDFYALAAAWTAGLREDDLVTDLSRWSVPCLIYAGTRDIDFFDSARRAADQIPGARFVALEGLSHLAAHENVDIILPQIVALIGAGSTGNRG
jgi:pimeloyl-ACP methyl ester carboxylesterase